MKHRLYSYTILAISAAMLLAASAQAGDALNPNGVAMNGIIVTNGSSINGTSADKMNLEGTAGLGLTGIVLPSALDKAQAR